MISKDALQEGSGLRLHFGRHQATRSRPFDTGPGVVLLGVKWWKPCKSPTLGWVPPVIFLFLCVDREQATRA